jgi:hypothetical protein
MQPSSIFDQPGFSVLERGESTFTVVFGMNADGIEQMALT